MEDNKTVNNEEELNKNAEAQVDETVEEIVTEATDAAEEEVSEKTSRSDKKKQKKIDAELEKMKAEVAEANDKYMRLYAEYDNYRRRSAKEKEAAWGDAYCDAIEQILPILDNLERAAQYGGDDKESPLAKGLELTLKSFSETLEKMGVHEIEALGVEFNPEVHNAVMHVEDETLGENIVAEVFMKGYAKGDKVIRHSMVKVAN
ncbi:MAG: nucleotide exchange factor GrpE [Clostridia bacterium]|nr:nucleotide exchange factor GrpE [Clostridia bacterium]